MTSSSRAKSCMRSCGPSNSSAMQRSYCIAEARKAVGDNGRAQRVIKTVHGRGYRFIAPVVRRLSGSAPEEVATVPSPTKADPTPPATPGQSAPAVPLQHVNTAASAWPVSPVSGLSGAN